MTQTNPRLVLALSTLPSFVVHPLFSLIHSISAGIHYCATTFNHSISIASCQLLSYIPKYRQIYFVPKRLNRLQASFFAIIQSMFPVIWFFTIAANRSHQYCIVSRACAGLCLCWDCCYRSCQLSLGFIS